MVGKNNKDDENFIPVIRTLANDILKKQAKNAKESKSSGINTAKLNALKRITKSDKETTEIIKKVDELRHNEMQLMNVINKHKKSTSITDNINQAGETSTLNIKDRKKRLKKLKEEESITVDWNRHLLEKEKLKEKGLKVQNTKKHFQIENKPRDIKTIIVSILVLVLTALGVGALVVGYVGRTVPETINITEIFKPKLDILEPAKLMSINIDQNFFDWKFAILKQTKLNIIVKLIPFMATQDNGKRQIEFKELVSRFGLNLSNSLQNAIGEYYFLGEYKTKEKSNYFFIFSIVEYSNAIVSLLANENNLADLFVRIFPIVEEGTKLEIVSKSNKLIDNNNVKELTLSNGTKLYYYIINQTALIILLGDVEIINIINGKIRENRFSN